MHNEKLFTNNGRVAAGPKTFAALVFVLAETNNWLTICGSHNRSHNGRAYRDLCSYELFAKLVGQQLTKRFSICMDIPVSKNRQASWHTISN